jgi:hypothetical protein
MSTIAKWLTQIIKWLTSVGSVGLARPHVGLVRLVNMGSKRGAQGCEMGGVRDWINCVSWLAGPSDKPMDPLPRVINSVCVCIYIIYLY